MVHAVFQRARCPNWQQQLLQQDSSVSETSSVEFQATQPPATEDDSSSPIAKSTPLPNSDWLPTATTVTLLRDCTTEMTHSSVPSGHKENVYFLVDNSENIACHGWGSRCAYEDNCGAWNGGGEWLNNFPYICGDGGSLCRVFLSGGQYRNERKADGRRVYVPLDPQLPPATITTFTRYYATSAANATFN